MDETLLEQVGAWAVNIALFGSIFVAAFVLLTWRQRSPLGRALAAAILLAATAFIVWLIDWLRSGCSDTPSCGWEDGGAVIAVIWGAFIVVAIVRWVVLRRNDESRTPTP